MQSLSSSPKQFTHLGNGPVNLVFTGLYVPTFREPASGPFPAGQQFQNIKNVQFYIQRGSNDYQILTVGICWPVRTWGQQYTNIKNVYF